MRWRPTGRSRHLLHLFRQRREAARVSLPTQQAPPSTQTAPSPRSSMVSSTATHNRLACRSAPRTAQHWRHSAMAVTRPRGAGNHGATSTRASATWPHSLPTSTRARTSRILTRHAPLRHQHRPRRRQCRCLYRPVAAPTAARAGSTPTISLAPDTPRKDGAPTVWLLLVRSGRSASNSIFRSKIAACAAEP